MARDQGRRRASLDAADEDLRRVRAGAVIERRPPPDLAAYVERARTSCFICELVAGTPRHPHEIVYEDDAVIAFLNRFPTLLGQTIVAPKEHCESVTGDLGEDEYLALQRVVYRVGEALRKAVSTERLYVLSLGSQAANRHVHWHVAPLPPGVPYEEQQLAALDWSRGVLDLSAEEQAELARSIRDELLRASAPSSLSREAEPAGGA